MEIITANSKFESSVMQIFAVLCFLISINGAAAGDDFVSTACDIRKGNFDGMVYSTDVKLPWYGNRCEIKTIKPPFIQVIMRYCTRRYCCTEPCQCGGYDNAYQDNRCRSNATEIACFELSPARYNYTMYECCDGYQEIDHTCVQKINCRINNGNCSDYCLNNAEGNYSYCGCSEGRELVDFFTCAGPGVVAGSKFPGYIVGAVIGGFILFLLLLLLLLLLLCRRRKKEQEKQQPVVTATSEGFANPGYDKRPLPPIIAGKLHTDDILKAKIQIDDAYMVDEKKGVSPVKSSRVENDYSAAPGGEKGVYGDKASLPNTCGDAGEKIVIENNAYAELGYEKEEIDESLDTGLEWPENEYRVDNIKNESKQGANMDEDEYSTLG